MVCARVCVVDERVADFKMDHSISTIKKRAKPSSVPLLCGYVVGYVSR